MDENDYINKMLTMLNGTVSTMSDDIDNDKLMFALSLFYTGWVVQLDCPKNIALNQIEEIYKSYLQSAGRQIPKLKDIINKHKNNENS